MAYNDAFATLYYVASIICHSYSQSLSSSSLSVISLIIWFAVHSIQYIVLEQAAGLDIKWPAHKALDCQKPAILRPLLRIDAINCSSPIHMLDNTKQKPPHNCTVKKSIWNLEFRCPAITGPARANGAAVAYIMTVQCPVREWLVSGAWWMILATVARGKPITGPENAPEMATKVNAPAILAANAYSSSSRLNTSMTAKCTFSALCLSLM